MSCQQVRQAELAWVNGRTLIVPFDCLWSLAIGSRGADHDHIGSNNVHSSREWRWKHCPLTRKCGEYGCHAGH